MRRRRRLSALIRWAFLALLLLVQAQVRSRPALASASGCVLGSLRWGPGYQGSEPDCSGGNGGCYLCSYSNTGQDGYTICSELPDGSGSSYCSDVSQIPDDWPPPNPDEPDPDPGAPPPDAPPPDSPGTGGDGGGGGGGGDCLPPKCHEADWVHVHTAVSAHPSKPGVNLWLAVETLGSSDLHRQPDR